MTYRPAPTPTNLGAVPRFMDQELRRIGQEFGAVGQKLAYPSTSVLYAQSFASQQPTALNDAGRIQVSFGAAQGDASTPVALSAGGTVTINQTGLYDFGLATTMKQASNSKDVRIVLRVLIDNFQAGNPLAIGLADSSEYKQELLEFASSLPAGSTVKFEIMREVYNSGGLSPVVTGWGDTPSARLAVRKY